jgi:hypothetical protein
MYKIASNKESKPSQGSFISIDQDGYSLPSDWYLRLANATSKVVRGNLPNSISIPKYPLDIRQDPHDKKFKVHE